MVNKVSVMVDLYLEGSYTGSPGHLSRSSLLAVTLVSLKTRASLKLMLLNCPKCQGLGKKRISTVKKTKTTPS